MDVYQTRGRFYVLGAVGQRYTIRVSNPTNRRVEALVSVDGLDVIDGKAANLGKRGYVVPAGGELRVDGFRVSTQQVATFRFSSVSSSYAGRKGKARNVGVIGVAIFEERAPQEIILAEQPVARPQPRPRPRHTLDKRAERKYDYRADLKSADDADMSIEAEAEPAPPPVPASATGTAGLGGGRASANRPGRAPASRGLAKKSRKRVSTRAPARDSARCCNRRQQKDRPGLGTEFGERRQSGVSWTKFVRANQTVPTAMAELRYNNAAGLQALGIQLAPVDPNEIQTRETANPFPGGFAEPPR